MQRFNKCEVVSRKTQRKVSVQHTREGKLCNMEKQRMHFQGQYQLVTLFTGCKTTRNSCPNAKDDLDV